MRPSVKRVFFPTHPHTNYTQEGRAVTVRRDIEEKDLFSLFTPQRFFLHTAVKAKGGKIDESGVGANKCIAISRSLLSLSSGARRAEGLVIKGTTPLLPFTAFGRRRLCHQTQFPPLHDCTNCRTTTTYSPSPNKLPPLLPWK